MKNLISVSFLFLLLTITSSYLESHTSSHTESQTIHQEAHTIESIVRSLGEGHPIAVHFPIALIIMTGIAELFAFRSHSPIFPNAARFMIFAAALTATPAALLGLADAYYVDFSGSFYTIFYWHRAFGASTAIFAILTALFKELLVRKKIENSTYYYTLLILSVLFVSTAGYLGGELAE